jgi:DNA-binding NtrC family response regulator
MDNKSTADRRALALTGRVDGRQRLFVLSSGSNTIGRSSENDIVLAPSGVSSRHAVIQVEEGSVELTDLASKNGTFLDRERVDAAGVEIGQSVRFGPVALRLDSVRLEDTWLSVTSVKKKPRSTRNLSQTSTIASNGDLSGSESRRWLRLVDDVTKDLRSGASPGQVLPTVAGALGSSGIVLIEGTAEGKVIVLATHGEITGELPLIAIERMRSAARSEEEEQVESIEGEGPTLMIVTDHLGPTLVMAGEQPVEGDGTRLLRVIFRLLSRPASGSPEIREPSGSARQLRFAESYLPGSSRAMREVHREIASVAASDLPVLLVGETGVGKELLARTIHLSSERADERFSPMNCAAIPAELLEAELFGIAKGVATGVAGRRGKLALAHGGTVFLDEIGDMSPALQAKLLRALEEGVVQPVGGEAVEIDVRLLAATNTELGKKVESGDFREDLYYRLAGLVVQIPPLRQRRGDVSALIEHFFHRTVEESGRQVAGITYGAMQELRKKRWPGNVRELQHAIRRLVLQCPEGQAIDSSMVGALEKSPLTHTGRHAGSTAPDFSCWESLHLETLSRGVLGEAMRRSGGNQTAAAAMLGITRSSLRRRLVKLFPDGFPGRRSEMSDPDSEEVGSTSKW